ncbi:hypothetical protein AMECASPLE_005828 [Ameca splendens]|uniref:Uncharacterized protein n=1 Tax=Ameca splendens TaxID=208324 RepID=A0ABV0XN83_9TELE
MSSHVLKAFRVHLRCGERLMVERLGEKVFTAPCHIYEVSWAVRMQVFVTESDLLREDEDTDQSSRHTHIRVSIFCTSNTHPLAHALSDTRIQSLSVCLVGRKCRCSDGCRYHWLDTHQPPLLCISLSQSFCFHQCPLCLFTRLQSTVL